MRFLDLVLPWRCVACACPGDPLCETCRARLPLLRGPLCARCGAPTAWPVERCRECSHRRLGFQAARAAVAYDGVVCRLVGAWKERGLRHLAALAAGIVVETIPAPAVTCLTWIPRDRERGLRRGHHPAERLTLELAQRWDIPAAPLLGRTRASPRQRGLRLAERRRNVAGAFAARASPPIAVALVDDVYTTGATASEAALALRRAGARRVQVVTFARALR